MQQIDISHLDEQDIATIEAALDLANESEHGTGHHLALMSCLAGFGFRTNSTDEAAELAAMIVEQWRSTIRNKHFFNQNDASIASER